MKTYVVLLRGINVGGKNRLPMRELVAILEALGARRIRTYIQSGNAVLRHAARSPARLAGKIRAEIRKRHGFAPDALVLEPGDLEEAIAANPFPEAEADPKSLHLGFLASAPADPDLITLAGLKKDSERFLLKGRVFYLHAPEGVGRSKLAAGAEKLLGVPLTDRNLRTVGKLREMVDELDR